ncbi:MAG: Ppx/GppA phosphatase family protein [Ignavibacterium sp.]
MNIASIDIGSNTILLCIANLDQKGNNLNFIREEHRIARLGENLNLTKNISKERSAILISILTEYSEIIKTYNCEVIIAIGTNAFRIAKNADKVIQEVYDKLGIKIKKISGDEEAYLSFLGATYNRNQNLKSLVIDIGGGSTEIIIGKNNLIQFKKSFQLGVVTLTEKYIKQYPVEQKIIKILSEKIDNIFSDFSFDYKIDIALAIAGTPTTLACIKNNLTKYEEEKIEGEQLTKEELQNFIQKLSSKSIEQIKNDYGEVVKGREDLLLTGTIILLNIVNKFDLDKVIVSAKSLRHGVIIQYALKIISKE